MSVSQFAISVEFCSPFKVFPVPSLLLNLHILGDEDPEYLVEVGHGLVVDGALVVARLVPNAGEGNADQV